MNDATPHARLSLAGVLARGGVAITLGVLLACVLPDPFLAALTLPNVAARLALALPVSLLTLASALGLGVLTMRALRVSESPWTLALGVGLSLHVALVLFIGATGVYRSPLFALATVIPGLVALGRHARDPIARAHAATFDRPSVVLHAMLGMFGAMLALACSLPGVLWPSEFGGYDALSYHLPLAQQWMHTGRVWPTHDNVYSFLPSGLEALFMQQSLATFPLRGIGAPLPGMLARGGQGLFAAQVLHAMLALAAPLAVRDLTRRLVERHASIAGDIAGLLTLAAPWSIVVGTLAYNEMGLVLLGVCGGLALVSIDRTHAARMAVVLAILVGGACAIKPTALLFLGLPLGALLLVRVGVSSFVRRSLPVGVLVGLAMLSPWMVRNALDSSNPVFPFAPSVFARADGSMGHWSAEQVSRFARAHHASHESLARRVALMVAADETDPAGPRHRGLRHPQWGEMLVLALLAGAVLSMRLNNRALARALLLVMLAQLVVWLLTTHVQSRFLLPMLPVAAITLAMAIASLPTRQARITAMIATLALVWYRAPASMLPPSGLSLGMALSLEDRVPGGTPTPDAPPESIIAALPDSARVLLVGEAMPLYFATFPHRVRSITTWDASPIAGVSSRDDLMRLNASGISHLLVHFGELDRLARSGYLDPAIDIASLASVLREHARVLGVWQNGARVLFELPAA